MIKVHIPYSTGAVVFGIAAVFALVLSLAACEEASSPEGSTRDTGRFGDAYEILTNEHPDGPDEPPEIASDSLYVQVSYSGGCENHDFDLDTDIARDTTRLWLHHDSGGDDCEAMIHERLVIDLPADALESPTILLLNPNNEAPFVVRWRQE